MRLLPPNSKSIELFWQTANYLCAGMLYLEDNPLLRGKLQPHHFKKVILGHWGTCPGINSVYAHTTDLSRRSNTNIRFIVGTGHAGPAILSCLYLEGSLEKYYPQYTRDITGLTKLFKAFATPNGFSTEISPQYPGMFYCGGELGSALAFAQGYALNNPQSFSVCLIGDGELETSITQASWQGFKFLNPKKDGRVLPIINANGFKMGSVSLHAFMSRDEKESFYKGHGLFPIFAGPNHVEIANAFNKAFVQLCESKNAIQPVIILESPKGWTAPVRFGGEPFAGSYQSHKPILRRPSRDRGEMEMIEKWLSSYQPDNLFDDMGAPIPETLSCLPFSENLLGSGHELSYDTEWPASATQETISDLRSSVAIISLDLADRIKSSKDIIVFSPDELTSNKFEKVLGATKLKTSNLENSVYSPDGQVVEILNEHLCYAWSQGYSVAGRHPVFISYEAFSPIIDSMSTQHLKFLKGAGEYDWRPTFPSVNIILTSLGWHNCPTHHNPGYVDTLLGRNLNHLRVYMPVTPIAALQFFTKMMESKNRLNVMVISKHELPKIMSVASGISSKSLVSWRTMMADANAGPRISLIAVGDCMAEESLHARDIIKADNPNFSVQVLAVEDLSMLEDTKHPDLDSFRLAIAESASCVWAYNGYPKTIRGLLWNLGILNNHQVLGYRDQDQSDAGLDRFSKNMASRFDIARTAVNLYQLSKIHRTPIRKSDEGEGAHC